MYAVDDGDFLEVDDESGIEGSRFDALQEQIGPRNGFERDAKNIQISSLDISKMTDQQPKKNLCNNAPTRQTIEISPGRFAKNREHFKQETAEPMLETAKTVNLNQIPSSGEVKVLEPSARKTIALSSTGGKGCECACAI